MPKELEQVKEKLEQLSRLGNEPHKGNSNGNVLAQEALTALEAYEVRLDSSELEEERSFYITYQYTASDAIITASAAVHKVQGVLTCEVITSWAEQLNKEQGYENCNIIFYKELEKQPLKQ